MTKYEELKKKRKQLEDEYAKVSEECDKAEIAEYMPALMAQYKRLKIGTYYSGHINDEWSGHGEYICIIGKELVKNEDTGDTIGFRIEYTEIYGYDNASVDCSTSLKMTNSTVEDTYTPDDSNVRRLKMMKPIKTDEIYAIMQSYVKHLYDKFVGWNRSILK